MKKILITGGSGFIGTNLVFYLVKKNYIIFNIDKISKESSPEKFKKIKKNYFFYKLNLLNEKKLKELIFKIKPDIIINLAAESHVDRSIDSPKYFIINNILASFNLFKVLNDYYNKNKKIKIFHISTDEVYGSKNSREFSENSQYNPSSPYSASKGSSDLIANSFIETYKLPIIIFYISNNYGPFQFIEKFIPKIIVNYINNKDIPVYGRGNNIREWIHVKDTCSAIYKAINKNLYKEKFNIGSNLRYKNIYIIKSIIKILHNKIKIKSKSRIIFVKDRPGHDYRYAISSKKFRKVMNWKSKIPLLKGLEKTIDWYIKNNEWVKHSIKKYQGERQGKI
jgi:dTDP-glucose 4,6-dehydratase